MRSRFTAFGRDAFGALGAARSDTPAYATTNSTSNAAAYATTNSDTHADACAGKPAIHRAHHLHGPGEPDLRQLLRSNKRVSRVARFAA
jgi:hypothetical protein